MIIDGRDPPANFVLCGDIQDVRVWGIAARCGIKTWFASSPCPPWSAAKNAEGLNSSDGRLIIVFIAAAGLSGCVMALLENVAAIEKHQHFPIVKGVAKESGLPVICHFVDSCTPLRPVKRRRWMAILARSSVVDHLVLPLLSYMVWPNEVKGMDMPRNLKIADAIHVNMSPTERNVLEISPDRLNMLTDPLLLPPEDRKNEVTPEQAFQKRVCTPFHSFGSIMACYFEQHELPKHLLSSKGLFAFVMQIGDQYRLASFWEFAAAMGFGVNTCFPDDPKMAYRMIGNAITPAHAVLIILRAKALRGGKAPFVCNFDRPGQVASKLASHAIKLSKCFAAKVGDWWHLFAFDDGYEAPSQLPIQDVIAPISPTIQFNTTSHGGELVLHERFEETQVALWQRIATKIGQEVFMQSIAVPEGYCTFAVMVGSDQEIFVGMIERGLTIRDVLLRIFPQQVVDTIKTTMLNGDVHGLHSFVFGMPNWPNVIQVDLPRWDVNVQFGDSNISFDVVSSMTVADLKAKVVYHFGVPLTHFHLVQNDVPLCDDEMLDIDMRKLQLQRRFVWGKKGFAMILHEPLPSEVPHSDQCLLGVGENIRVSIRHPLWSTIRTIAVLPMQSVGQVVASLLPDYELKSLEVHSSENIVDWHQNFGSVMKESELWVDFLFVQPIPSQRMFVSVPGHALAAQSDAPTCRRWVQSPMHSKSTFMVVDPMQSLVELGACFFRQSNSMQTIMCLIDGKQVDPRCLIGQTEERHTLVFRACPLPGGGKHSTHGCKR